MNVALFFAIASHDQGILRPMMGWCWREQEHPRFVNGQWFQALIALSSWSGKPSVLLLRH